MLTENETRNHLLVWHEHKEEDGVYRVDQKCCEGCNFFAVVLKTLLPSYDWYSKE